MLTQAWSEEGPGARVPPPRRTTRGSSPAGEDGGGGVNEQEGRRAEWELGGDASL